MIGMASRWVGGEWCGVQRQRTRQFQTDSAAPGAPETANELLFFPAFLCRKHGKPRIGKQDTSLGHGYFVLL
jgi:hypothetical protein